jgi:hypothetical protein
MFQKITSILDASSNVTKCAQNHFGENDPLGVNKYGQSPWLFFLRNLSQFKIEPLLFLLGKCFLKEWLTLVLLKLAHKII